MRKLNSFTDWNVIYHRGNNVLVAKDYRRFYAKRPGCLIYTQPHSAVAERIQLKLGSLMPKEEFQPLQKQKIWCINSSLNTLRFIRENEKTSYLVNEALKDTIPTKLLSTRFKEKCSKILPNDLVQLTYGQIGYNEPAYDNTRLLDDIQLQDEDAQISRSLAAQVPVYVDADNEHLIRELTKIVRASGYEVTDVRSEDIPMQPFAKKVGNKLKMCVEVLVFQIEANYSEMKPALSNFMYHVAPISAFDSIKAKGLLPMSNSADFEYPKRIYLFNRGCFTEQIDYGVDKIIKTAYKKPHDWKFCIFKVDTQKLMQLPDYKSGKMKFYCDGAYADLLDDMAVFTYEPIPSSVLCDDVLVISLNSNGESKSQYSKLHLHS